MDETDVAEVMIDFFGFYIPTSVAKLIFLGVVVLIALIAGRIATRSLKRILRHTNVPSATIFVNLVRALIWVFALLVVLQPVFGIEPTAFVAALGVTSVALSLGLQDTISNVFGGLSLMTSKVIEPGDAVSISGTTGEVVDINWRSTIVRECNGDMQVIPNSVLSKTSLIKLAPFQVGECQLPVVIAYGADLNAVREDCDKAAKEVLGEHLDDTFGTSVFVQELNGTGMVATISIHVCAGYSRGQARTAVAERIMNCPWVVRPS